MHAGTPDLGRLAAEIAAAAPPGGAGTLAAGVVALAAGLCESVARAAAVHQVDVRGAIVQAMAVRQRAKAVAAANAAAYEVAREALEGRSLPVGPGRDGALRAALLAAADTLAAVAGVAADCAGVAAEVARLCEPALRADAAGAADLAVAAAHAAQSLTAVNLAVPAGDDRLVRAGQCVAAAESASRRARVEAGLGDR